TICGGSGAGLDCAATPSTDVSESTDPARKRTTSRWLDFMSRAYYGTPASVRRSRLPKSQRRPSQFAKSAAAAKAAHRIAMRVLLTYCTIRMRGVVEDWPFTVVVTFTV